MIPEFANRATAKAIVLKVCDSVPAPGEFYVIGGELRKVVRIDEAEILTTTQLYSRYYINWTQWMYLVEDGALKFVCCEIDDYGIVTGDIDDSRAWDEARKKARSLGLLHN